MDLENQNKMDIDLQRAAEDTPQIMVLSEKPTNWIGLALACLGVFLGVSIVVALIVSTVGAAMYGSDIMSGEGLSNVTNVSSIIADVIVAVILVSMLRRRKIWSWVPKERRPAKNAENIVMAIIMFLAFFYVEVCAGELLDSFLHTKEATLEQQEILTYGNRLLMLVNVAIIVPITEEIVFRGGVYGSLKKTVGVVPAAILSAVAFGVAHLSGWISIVTFFMGLLLCLVYEKTGSIIYPIAIHAINNFVSVTLEEIYLPGEKIAMAALAIGCGAVVVLIALLFCRRNQDI